MEASNAGNIEAACLPRQLQPGELSRRWPVIVIGAGPAGCAAAIECARRGLKVLLVDSKPFPRRKACGGCLNRVSTELASGLLGEQHALWSESLVLRAFRLRLAGKQFTFELPAGLAVDRTRFDFALVQRAIRQGVTFAPATRAQLLENDQTGRWVELNDSRGKHRMLASAVVVACGLGGRAVADVDALRQQPRPTSRLGVEAILSVYPGDYSPGMIHMAVGSAGYVGLTQLHDQRLHVAAAVDRGQLQQLGPAESVQSILQQAGATLLPANSESAVEWRGTPPLTSRPRRISDRRVFLVGDAAGYVEPFTGEGIRWALESGLAVAAPVEQAVSQWDDSLITQWNAWYKRHIVPEQQLCRRLAAGLRSPAARWLALHLLRLRPQFAHRVICRLNRKH